MQKELHVYLSTFLTFGILKTSKCCILSRNAEGKITLFLKFLSPKKKKHKLKLEYVGKVDADG